MDKEKMEELESAIEYLTEVANLNSDTRYCVDVLIKSARPTIMHCCRQDDDGEFVDESEYSDNDVTLAVIDNEGVYCMECRKELHLNPERDEGLS